MVKGARCLNLTQGQKGCPFTSIFIQKRAELQDAGIPMCILNLESDVHVLTLLLLVPADLAFHRVCMPCDNEISLHCVSSYPWTVVHKVEDQRRDVRTNCVSEGFPWD